MIYIKLIETHKIPSIIRAVLTLALLSLPMEGSYIHRWPNPMQQSIMYFPAIHLGITR